MVSTSFCKCGKCVWMSTRAERVCCKAKKFKVKMSESKCVIEHEDFEKIINKVRQICLYLDLQSILSPLLIIF